MPAAGIALLPLFWDSIWAIIRPLFHFIHVIVAFFPIAGSVNPSDIFPSPASGKNLSLFLCRGLSANPFTMIATTYSTKFECHLSYGC
jgi:hypothetical protein